MIVLTLFFVNKKQKKKVINELMKFVNNSLLKH